MLSELIQLDIYNVLMQVLDVFSLSLIFFYVYKLLKTIRSNIFLVRLAFFFVLYALAFLLNLQALLWFLNNTIVIVLLGTLIIFQPELRAIITRKFFSNTISIFKKKMTFPDFTHIARSINLLKTLNRGAIIILQKNVDIEGLIPNKVALDATISAELLVSIFSHDTILHDGAVIIKHNRIVFANCFLPLELGIDIPPQLGSRHRAAVGISQNSDAVVIVLSEEKGVITLVYQGQLFYDLSIDKICHYAKLMLEDSFVNIELENYLNIEETK